GQVALFTNPQGIYNAWSGTWDPPPGHQWNGKYWYEPKKVERKRRVAAASDKAAAAKSAKKAKARREAVSSSSDDSDVKPKKKRLKAAVKQATGDSPSGEARAVRLVSGGQNEGSRRGNASCFQCGQMGHWATQCPNEVKCYACNKAGHFARACPDAEAKSRNDAYMKSRGQSAKSPGENEERA
ncbi:hypothetical protein PR001_g33589, partial [Phytophthora rubi]